MERILKIKEVLPMRSFDSTTGSAQKVNVLPIILTDGINSIFAEAMGDVANRLIADNLFAGSLVSVRLSASCRKRTTQDSKEWYSNDVRILDMAKLTD